MNFADFLRLNRKEEREKRLILGKADLLDELRVDRNKNWAVLRENEDDLFQKWYNKTIAPFDVPQKPSEKLRFKQRKSRKLSRKPLKKQHFLKKTS